MILFWLIFAIALVFWVRKVQRNRKNETSLPPRPPSEPILGHLRIFPLYEPSKTLYRWSKSYGDVMYFNTLGKSVIVLSSVQAITDLLEKRSAIYSDRPSSSMYDLLNWGDWLVFTRYGSGFHPRRKLMREPFTQVHSHIRRYAASIIMDITYGHKVMLNDDRSLNMAKEIDHMLQVAGEAAILDLFPLLTHLPAWFPGAWFARYARDTQHIRDEMTIAPFEQVRHELATGNAQPSFVSMHLEDMESNGTDDDVEMLKKAAVHLFASGTDTTFASILNALLGVLLHPEAQRTTQDEIDHVVGLGRLPDFSDRGSLPYLDCLLQECRRYAFHRSSYVHTWLTGPLLLRMYPTVPLGIPHCVTEDDVYRGMLIPKGSTILANSCAMGMDETVYHDPNEFRPERFCPENGEPYPTGLFYGYGRRICPGRYLADANIWIAVATILAVFDIVKMKDEHGRDITPFKEFSKGLVSHPLSLKCEFRLRRPEARMLIEDSEL